MTEGSWKSRVLAAVDAYKESHGGSDNDLSKRAKLGRNYIQQMRDKDPEAQTPRVGELQKLCDMLDISLVYVLTGLQMDPDGEELIRLLADKSRAAKRHVIGLLKD